MQSTTERASNKPPVGAKFVDDPASTEVVTLERVDNQKNMLMKTCYFKKATDVEELGVHIKPSTLFLETVNFGVKSRFVALTTLLEN